MINSPTDTFFEKWTSNPSVRDAVEIRIRPLKADDRELVPEFVDSLSEESRYFRLFTPLRFLPRELLEQLMNIDYDRQMAFVATVESKGGERLVGAARYAATDQAGTAEFGVTVADAWQRCGLARLLLRELMRFAHSRGFRRLVGIALPENRGMIALARRLGFRVAMDPAERLVHISRELDG